MTSYQEYTMAAPVYIVYGRFSGEGQRGNSSVERQMDVEHYRAQAGRYGLPFVEIPFFDDAKSGYHGDNLEAELGKIFDDIKSGALPPGSIIGTESHSRLGRLSANEALYQYLDILRTGVHLDIKGRALRTWESIGGLTGVLVLMEDFIDMVIAHKHSADLSKTERDTNDIKRKAIREGRRDGTMKKGGPGWFVGNRCPAWLTPVSEPVVYDGHEFMYRINDDMAETVRMIFRWADEGIGTRIIARRLTDQGIEPLGNAHRRNPAKKLDSWSAGMVGALLHNIGVIGLWQPKTRTRDGGVDATGRKIKLSYAHKVIDGAPIPYYPPIISREQFDRVRRQMRARKEAAVGGAYAAGGRKGRGFGNLIYKIGRCGCCEDGRLTLWSRTRGNRSGPAKYLRCENSRRSKRKCINIHGFDYTRFESLLLALFHHDMRPFLAALTPIIPQNNVPNRAQLNDIMSQIESKKAAYHEYHVELDDLRGEERKAQRKRMAELLAEVAALEEDRVGLALELREAERIGQVDYDERVREGIARLQAGDETERENARHALNRMLAERVDVLMYDDRRITVMMRGDRRTGFVTFTPDHIVDAGTLDEHGQRVTEMDAVWLPLARVGMGLENFRATGAKLAATLEEIAADPIIREALASVRSAV